MIVGISGCGGDDRAMLQYTRSVDVVSESVGGLHAGQPCIRRFGESGDWGWSHDAFSGIGFHVMLQGQGWVTGENKPPQPVSAGDVIVAPQGGVHGFSLRQRQLSDLPRWQPGAEVQAAEPGDVDFICGSYRLARSQPHHFLRTLPAVMVVSGEGTERLLANLIADDVDGHRPGADAARVALIDLMLVTVLRRWHEREGEHVGLGPGHPAIAGVLSAIHADPGGGWGLTRLSRTAGMSKSSFTRLFKTAVGETPMAYVTTMRLGLAARLLLETRRSLAAIAREVGYANEFAFASAFRRRYGIAPGKFRRTPGPDPDLTMQA